MYTKRLKIDVKKLIATFKNLIINRIPLLLVLLFYLLWVGFTYKGFGVAIDEPLEYGFGEMMYNRTFGKDPILINSFAHEEKNSREIWAYNHFHQMILYIFNDAGSIEVYHLLNMIFAVLGIIVAYEITRSALKSYLLAMIGPLFLITLPRFFGDLPTNVKDPVFAVYYLLGLFMIMLSPKIKPSWLRIILLGITFGLAAAFRTVGYSLLLVYVIIELKTIHKQKKWFNNLSKSLIFTFLILLIMIGVHAIEMPFVASNPIDHLIRLMEVARKYPWDGEMLYMGKTIMASDLPWHYPLVWAGVVSPVFILLMGFVGLKFVNSSRETYILTVALLVNIALYYLLKPIIYDGIRHLLYILVIFAILAGIGFGKLLLENKNKWAKIFLGGMFFLHLIVTFNQYRLLHPYEYVYFNELTGFLPGAYGKFETDYWGVSYYEGARWLLSQMNNSNSNIIGLCGNKYAEMYFKGSGNNVVWLPNCINMDNSIDYVMAMGRNDEWNLVPGNELHSVVRSGVPLMKIFKTN